MEEVLERRWTATRTEDLSPHDGKRDASFGSLPSLIVIDGGKGQLAAAMRGAAAASPSRGVTVISLAKREEEVFVPGRAEPIVLAADSEALAAAAAGPRRGPPLRDRATTAARRDRAMSGSVLDELQGVGPGRASAPCSGTSARRSGCSPRAARSSRRCPGCRAKSPARSTSS